MRKSIFIVIKLSKEIFYFNRLYYISQIHGIYAKTHKTKRTSSHKRLKVLGFVLNDDTNVLNKYI